MQQKHLYSLLDTSYVTILVQFGAIFAAAGGGSLGIGRRQPDREDQIPS